MPSDSQPVAHLLQTEKAPVIEKCLRDIVALSTMPAMWHGAEPLRIAESLAAALFTTLGPEFVYVCFPDAPGQEPIQVAQIDRYQTSSSIADVVGSAIQEWVKAHDHDELLALPNPTGSGTLRVAVRPVGLDASLGVVAAAFGSNCEPTAMHGIVLNVAATQAATAIQNARLLRSLRESTAQFEDLLKKAPLGVYVIDADFRIRNINPTAYAAFENISDLVGQRLDEVLYAMRPREYANEIIRIFRRTLETGKPFHRLEHITPKRRDRGVEYFEWHTDQIPLPDGRNGVVCYFRNITPQVKARVEIAESEERFRTLVSVITDVPWVADAQGAFATPQLAWEAYTGQSWEESRGFGWADALHPEDRVTVLERWRRACETGTTYESRGRLWHAGSRQYRYFVVRATPIRTNEGRIREWVGSCTDVHEQRMAEEALREADRRKDEFLATLAHELRNPLAPIGNALQVLRFVADNGPAVEQTRQMMERQLRQMVRLVDDLLDVSRITLGKVELRKERIELASVVVNALETSRPLIDACRHTLSVSLPSAPVYLDADATRLAQVISNLLNNAAKYTPDGGQIWLSATTDAGSAIIRVRDTGLGIPAEMLSRVFDLFTQVDRSIDRTKGGLGIGLTLVRSLVEMHGGAVEAQSNGLGQGSEFIVRLPLAAQPTSTVRHSGASDGVQTPERAARRILVVDDNRDSAESLAELLQLLGNAVQVAFDGRQALEMAKTFVPEVVLLDIGLPGMNGYEVAKQMRLEPKLKKTLLVAQTGWGQEEDRQRALDAGFDHHLVKPVDPMALDGLLTGSVDRGSMTERF